MIQQLFPTQVYTARITKKGSTLLNDIASECDQYEQHDEEGRAWSASHYLGGYTSYATLNSLHLMSSTFRELEEKIRPHAYQFAEALEYNLCGGELTMIDCWVNKLGPGAGHSAHIHPLSCMSGTFYVHSPEGSSGIRFEDPRLPGYMAAPPRKKRLKKENRQFVSVPPTVGTIVLFESWLRHEVPAGDTGEEDRVSVSFNYHWQ